MQCPCGSGSLYTDCCGKYHQGAVPENALALMRSRYSAYALDLPDYIMATTHPLNPSYDKDTLRWRSSIKEFSRHTKFENLTIINFEDVVDAAFVTFRATLSQQGKDVSFTEKSRFEKINNRWLYHSGEFIKP